MHHHYLSGVYKMSNRLLNLKRSKPFKQNANIFQAEELELRVHSDMKNSYRKDEEEIKDVKRDEIWWRIEFYLH